MVNKDTDGDKTTAETETPILIIGGEKKKKKADYLMG